MSPLLLAFNNRANAATLSGGGWGGPLVLPLNNLKTKRLAQVARSTDATLANTLFSVDLGASYSLRIVALVNHTFSTTAKVRIRASNTSAADAISAPLRDTGWVNAKRLTFYGDTPANWGARYPVLDVFAALTVRYLYIEIDDTTNAAGYVQIGRLFIAGGFQPTHTASRGQKHARRDLSTVAEMVSGADFGTARRRQRTRRFDLNWLSQAEADRYDEMQDEVGIVEEVFYVPDPSDLVASQRYGFLGRLRELGALEAPNASIYSVPVEITERLP
jgi:hypothetical protein